MDEGENRVFHNIASLENNLESDVADRRRQSILVIQLKYYRYDHSPLFGPSQHILPSHSCLATDRPVHGYFPELLSISVRRTSGPHPRFLHQLHLSPSQEKSPKRYLAGRSKILHFL